MNTNQTLKLFAISLLILFTASINAQNSVTKAIKNGNWNAAGTWDNGVPNANKQAIISKGFRVNVQGNHTAKEIVVHGELNIPENGTLNKSLTTRWMHVNSGGIFRIGTPGNRFDRGTFTLTFTGTNPTADHRVVMANGMMMDITDNDGFLMAGGGGRLQFFGEEKLPFTKLSRTANAGANIIVVANIIDRNHNGSLSGQQDGVLNWKVGDEIVIASSSTLYKEEDVRTITAIQKLGNETRLTLNTPLTYRHYGKIETYGQNVDSRSKRPNKPISIDMRAEVALLSRNIKIQGLASQDTDNKFGDRVRLQTDSNGKAKNGVGGHIMIMPTAGQITVEGVQLNLMGQSGRLGRYPFHWHIARDRSGDVFKNSSITNSNNRAVVVHTTNNVLVEGIVAHDIHGHCFFTEDGVETGNKFINNIAFGVHRVHKKANKGEAFIVDDTDKFFDGGDRFRATAAFWIANGDNDLIGNVVAGSQGSGYWYAQPEKPRGAARNIPEFADYKPREVALSLFKNNSVHSSRTGFVTKIRQTNGEFGQNEKFFNNVDPVFENLTVYQTGVGLYPLYTNITHIFKNFKSADNNESIIDSDPTIIDGGLMVGLSKGNPNVEVGKSIKGNVLYHGNLILKDIHIGGYTSGVFIFSGSGNRVRPACEVEGLTFENDNSIDGMNKTQRSDFVNAREVYDRDGSLTGPFGGGPGYTFIVNTEWTVDQSLGEVAPQSKFRWVLSKQRFADLQMQFESSKPALKTPRMIFTSPHGVVREWKERDRKRVQLRHNAEYKIELPNGINFSTQKLAMSLHQWSLPSNSIGVVLRFVNMANTIKPQDFKTRTDLPRLNQLSRLKNANRDSYYTANNGDLYVKIMNRGQGIHENFIWFAKTSGTNPNSSPSVRFSNLTNNQRFDEGTNLLVNVNASDSDGSISNVKLFLNGNLVRQERVVPYSWGEANQNDTSLANLSTGAYTLKAVATDNNGNTSETSIRIIVRGLVSENCRFNKLNGKGYDIGSGNGKTYLIGLNRRVYVRENNGWKILPDGNFLADRIDVSNAGDAWIVDSNRRIHLFKNNRWSTLNGIAQDIGTGGNSTNGNSTFVIGNDGFVYKRENARWRLLNNTLKAKRIDASGSGEPWIVAEDNFVYQFKNNKWFKKGNFKALDLSFAEGGDNLWALSETAGNVHFYRGSGVWITQSGAAMNISVDEDNSVWVVSSDKNVFIGDCAIPSRIRDQDSITTSEEIKLFPNPVANVLNIDMGLMKGTTPVVYQILSLEGKSIRSGVLDRDNSIKALDVSNLSNGFYLLNIKTGNTQIVHKFIKDKTQK